MALQAYIDDSVGPDGTFVLAGHIATAETWLAFAAEWEKLLPLARLGRSGRRRFKMVEMAKNEDGMRDSQAFWRVIENHVQVSVSVAINKNDLLRARDRISVPNLKINWGIFRNPFWMAFHLLLDPLHSLRTAELAPYLPPDDKIDFIFDEQQEKGQIMAGWEAYSGSRAEYADAAFGATPRFENDEEFLPLQAADFWAWWVRKWFQEGAREKIENPTFGQWAAKRDWPRIVISSDEDGLVSIIKTHLRAMIEPDRPIIDSKYPT